MSRPSWCWSITWVTAGPPAAHPAGRTRSWRGAAGGRGLR
jgi:hypothetical protein